MPKNSTHRIAGATLLAFGFSLLLVSWSASRAADAETGVVIGDRVNVRARPLGTAEICCQLKKDDKVEILERREIQTATTNAEIWLRIVLPETATVWVKAELLEKADNQDVVLKRANGRAGPGLAWPSLCILSAKDVVSVRTNATEWVGIVPPRSASGWVAGRLVQKEGQTPSTPPESSTPQTDKSE